jgi:hypothetical protein
LQSRTILGGSLVRRFAETRAALRSQRFVSAATHLPISVHASSPEILTSIDGPSISNASKAISPRLLAQRKTAVELPKETEENNPPEKQARTPELIRK